MPLISKFPSLPWPLLLAVATIYTEPCPLYLVWPLPLLLNITTTNTEYPPLSTSLVALICYCHPFVAAVQLEYLPHTHNSLSPSLPSGFPP
ncbi:hypothetical protein IWX90DRAFT_445958 [Phyllosticta citrichinensis]|uniref:Secreted protein n=1 Tax=Phyllosticta citrichinensis TaxID=1130410 RepID=A0ABR1XFG6_9PEZI